MPRQNSSTGDGGMLGALKSRLGFGAKRDDSREWDEGAYDDYADDDLYDDYAYDEPVSTRRTYRSDARFGSGEIPRLVSIDDVRASTQVPERLTRDPLADLDRTSRASGRTMVGNSGPAPSSPAYNARAKAEPERSEGYNSLFSPTTPAATQASASYDPYEAYSSSASAAYSPERSLSVLKPVAYGDVERIAKVLKSGDVVVIVLRNTPSDLSKRVLDFSFGVASALDASVDSPAEKVFVITRGQALSAGEMQTLREEGVI
jgi:cell division inhibitor SepF